MSTGSLIANWTVRFFAIDLPVSAFLAKHWRRTFHATSLALGGDFRSWEFSRCRGSGDFLEEIPREEILKEIRQDISIEK